MDELMDFIGLQSDINNSIILQGGLFNPNGDIVTITFPIAFTTYCWFVSCVSDNSDVNAYFHREVAFNITNIGFSTIWKNSVDKRRWIAIGY